MLRLDQILVSGEINKIISKDSLLVDVLQQRTQSIQSSGEFCFNSRHTSYCFARSSMPGLRVIQNARFS